MFNDEIGPQTGEMGTAGFWYGPEPAVQQHPPEDEDASCPGYTGYIDINCIVNSRGIYPLALTCRFGYPTINLKSRARCRSGASSCPPCARERSTCAQARLPDLRRSSRSALPVHRPRRLPQVLRGRRRAVQETDVGGSSGRAACGRRLAPGRAIPATASLVRGAARRWETPSEAYNRVKNI